jgi:ABC-2 type transport system permease protein
MPSLQRVIADLKITARGFIRSRVGLFFSLVFPIILILLFGSIFSGSSGPAKVYIQNNDQGVCQPTVPFCAATFISALNSTKAMTLVLVPSSENFTKYLLAHSSTDGIIIPQGFQNGFLSGKPVNVTVYGNPASTTSAIVSGVTMEIANGFNLERARGTSVIAVSSLTIKAAGTKYIDFFVPGMIGFAILTSPMFALVNISSQYKRDKLFKQLSLTPLTKSEWLMAKVLWYILITFGSFILMTAVGVYAFGAHVSFSLYLVPFLILGPLLFVSLGMLVGTVSNSVESAAVVGNLITFPMMFLSGTFFPVSMFPSFLQGFAHVLPLFYVIDGLNNVMIYNNIGPALWDLGVLVVISVIIFGLAVRFFKWRED